MKFKNFLNSIIKKSDDIVVNMDGGVENMVREEDIECAIDENVVECAEMDSPSFRYSCIS